MASLIDVIFLLLLFFMLSPTFSKLSSEVDTRRGRAIGRCDRDRPPMRLLPEQLSLNGCRWM